METGRPRVTNRRVSDRHESAGQNAARVALFTGAYNHIADGVSLTLNRLVDFVEPRGFDVLVFAPTIDDPPIRHAGSLEQVPSISAPGRPDYRLSLGMPVRLRRRLDALAPDLIHIATPDLLGRSALVYGRKHNIPVVATYHTHFSSYLKYYRLNVLKSLLWVYLRWFYNQCDEIYVPSQSMLDVLRSEGITSSMRLWPRGVDTKLFNPTKRSTEWRRQQAIGDNEVVVTFVSRLVWEKGLGVFADVVESLRARGIPHRSMIVGEGPARAELEARLPGTLFTGYKDGEKLAVAYASSDIFLFPSDTETFGNVTLEAMASGLPAVCANATGSNTLVVPDVTGFLSAPADVRSFSENVEKLIRNADLRGKMSADARTQACEFDWDAVLEKMRRYYLDVLNLDDPLSKRGGLVAGGRSVGEAAV